MKSQEYRFYMPLYWPLWFVIGIFWLLTQLPYRWLLFIGKMLGLVLYKFAKQLRSIAKTNIDLCFPELSSEERKILLKKNFISYGIAIFEMCLAWWGSDKRLRKLLHIEGAENFYKAAESGKGVIMMGAHFTTLEIVGRLLAIDHDFVVFYRKHKKPFVNFLIKKILSKTYSQAIERSNVRTAVKALKEKKVMWYTPDIDAGHYHNIFVPFFGIPVSTLVASVRLPKLADAKVIPTTFYRRDDGTGYDFVLLPPLENFPSGDDEKDALRINKFLEDAIRKKPEQYIWAYMRFKTRPNNEARFYSRKKKTRN